MDTYIKGHGLLPGRKAGGSYAPKGSPGTLGTSQGKNPKYKRLIMMLCIDSIKLHFVFITLAIRAKLSTADPVSNRPSASSFSSRKPKVW